MGENNTRPGCLRPKQDANFTTHTNRFQRTRVVTIRVSRVLNRSMPETKDELPAIGIIGGSGLYQIEELRDAAEHSVNTPFGPPSDTLFGGRISGRQVYFST